MAKSLYIALGVLSFAAIATPFFLALKQSALSGPAAVIDLFAQSFAGAVASSVTLELFSLGVICGAFTLVEGPLSGLRLRGAYLVVPAVLGYAPVFALFLHRRANSRTDGTRMPRLFSLAVASVFVIVQFTAALALLTTSALALRDKGKSESPISWSSPFGVSLAASLAAVPALVALVHRTSPLKSSDDAVRNKNNARVLYAMAFGAATMLFVATKQRAIQYLFKHFSAGGAITEPFQVLFAGVSESFAVLASAGDLAGLVLCCIVFIFTSDSAGASKVTRLFFAVMALFAPSMAFSAFLAITSRTRTFATKIE